MKTKYILLTIIAFIALIGIGYAVFQNVLSSTITTNNVAEQPNPQVNNGNKVIAFPNTPMEEEWIEYVSEELGIKFKYPSNYRISDEPKGDVRLRSNSENREENIVLDFINEEYSPANPESVSNNSSKLSTVKIDGDIYKFKKYMVGESGVNDDGCGWSSLAEFYYTYLPNKTYIAIGINNSESCKEGNSYPVKTPDELIDIGIKILESIEFIK